MQCSLFSGYVKGEFMAKNKSKGVIEKALKPSQRESITEFSAHFGSEPSYEEKVRARRIISIILIILAVTALIALGYFVTDVLVRITEMPYEPPALFITETVQ